MVGREKERDGSIRTEVSQFFAHLQHWGAHSTKSSIDSFTAPIVVHLRHLYKYRLKQETKTIMCLNGNVTHTPVEVLGYCRTLMDLPNHESYAKGGMSIKDFP